MSELLERLSEGIVQRDRKEQTERLKGKWEETGLLKGLEGRQKENMSQLLENQTKELLRESSTMAGGDVEGFASVAFPIVRRVFGDLIANDLVSVQPMSLPSGLIFFLDFQFDRERLGQEAGDSLYGGGRVGSEITGGVDLTDENAEESAYALNQGYSSPTGSTTSLNLTLERSGTVGEQASDELMADVNYDVDLSGSNVAIGSLTISNLENNDNILNRDNLVGIQLSRVDLGTGAQQIRRLTQFSGSRNSSDLLVVVKHTGSVGDATASLNAVTGATFPLADDFDQASALGAVIGDPLWGLEDEKNIPEIDIQVDSVAVTAITKKLKAKWTPELGQDLNAYHNLDAEVELTSILSEQVELEIDREILEDLVKGAEAGVLYWSRRPGDFVQRETGSSFSGLANPPDFTGNVSEWYETLIETINEVSARIRRLVRRGGATFIVCGPEVANILETTNGWRSNVAVEDNQGDAGAINVGSINAKFDVYVDPYFFRNVILVGRKGGSFLETGYVYAPYVPLQITPTIFGIEDFVPRKGIMTRYAKKMVRPDMYGLVVVEHLLG